MDTTNWWAVAVPGSDAVIGKNDLLDECLTRGLKINFIFWYNFKSDERELTNFISYKFGTFCETAEHKIILS